MRDEVYIFHSSALEEYISLYDKAYKSTRVKYKILLTASMIRNMVVVSNV